LACKSNQIKTIIECVAIDYRVPCTPTSPTLQSTGLDLLQLNNWFINARVRIWRPIIGNVYNQQLGRLMAMAQAQVRRVQHLCSLP